MNNKKFASFMLIICIIKPIFMQKYKSKLLIIQSRRTFFCEMTQDLIQMQVLNYHLHRLWLKTISVLQKILDLKLCSMNILPVLIVLIKDSMIQTCSPVYLVFSVFFTSLLYLKLFWNLFILFIIEDPNCA